MIATILTTNEVRVLGALIEKQLSTPEYYPLTLNALIAACNQKSNRDPVVSFDEEAVRQAIEGLRQKQLARIVFEGNGRVAKYSHAFTSALNLDRREVAILCELMLRGAQTVGELRARTGRLQAPMELGEVEETLRGLAEREGEPLVKCLPRQAGMKEPRHAHLLAGEPALPAESPAGAPAASPGSTAADERIKHLEAEVTALKGELAELREQFADFRRQFE